MWEGYRAYTYRYWEGQCDPAKSLIPDAILVPFIAGLTAAPIPAHLKILKLQSDKAVRTESWPWDRTLAFVHDVWEFLHADYRFEFNRLHALKPTRFESIPGMHFTSGGHCSDDGIVFQRDGSLMDPVYMMHESGHLLGKRNGPEQPGITELQGFFAREAAYGCLMIRNGAQARAAGIHRVCEYAMLLDDIHIIQDLLKKRNPDAIDDLIVHGMHRHVFAGLISVYLYHSFKGMNALQQRRALHALYDGGGTTSLQDVMQVFGLQADRQFHSAGELVFKSLHEQGQKLGLLNIQEMAPSMVLSAIARPA